MIPKAIEIGAWRQRLSKIPCGWCKVATLKGLSGVTARGQVNLFQKYRNIL